MGNSLLLDGLLIFFLLISAMIGSRIGLIRSLSGLLKLFAAGAGAFFLANLLYPVVGLIFLFDGIQKKIAALSQNLSVNVFSGVADGIHSLQNQITQAAASLSELAQKTGVPKLVADSFAANFINSPPRSGETFIDAAARVVSDNIAYILVFLIAFVIILMIISFFVNWLIGLIRFIVPRFIDRFFGFFFGITIGCLWVILFFQFAGNAVPALFELSPLLSSDTVQHSFLVTYLARADILSFLPGMLKTSLFSGSE